MADPGWVVVASDTRRLLGAAFELEALGPYSLKGFDKPVPAFRVVSEVQAESRFEARQSGALL